MLSTSFVLAGTNPVLPNAIGFGTETRAAYGAANDPIIYIVDNIGTSSSAPTNSTRNGVPVKVGSLLACINHTPPSNTGKIIIFEVSGTIHALSSPYQYIIDEPYTAIYGQTAPSPGITLRNITLTILTNDVIVQHLRVRTGDAVNGLDPTSRDCIGITAGPGNTVNNVVIDHCSASWSVDEVTQVYDNSETGSITNVTLSNNIIAEGLKGSIHPDGPHSKGSQLSTWTFPTPSNIALLNNIIAHCVDRTPMIAIVTNIVVANNLMYNNEWFNSWWGPSRIADVNITGNVGLGGPSSGSYVKNSIMTVWNPYNDGIGSNLYLLDNRAGEYVDGSIVWNEIQSDSNDWSHVDIRFGEHPNNFKVTSPTITIPGAIYLNSSDVLESTIKNAGARPADRDSVDTRIINDILNGTGNIINSPSDIGGWPNLAVNHRTLVIPSNPHADDNHDGYTNLEEWLHDLNTQVVGSTKKSIKSPILKIVKQTP